MHTQYALHVHVHIHIHIHVPCCLQFDVCAQDDSPDLIQPASKLVRPQHGPTVGERGTPAEALKEPALEPVSLKLYTKMRLGKHTYMSIITHIHAHIHVHVRMYVKASSQKL